MAAGILLACAIRRAWRPMLIAGAAVAPFFGFLCWRTVFPPLPVSPASGPASASLGWAHTWAYYTSYAADWRQGVPNLHVFLPMLRAHFEVLITTPAWYFVHIPPDDSPLVPPLTVTVGVACMAGLVRQRKFRPAYVVFGLYSVLVILWNYGQAVRFLVPFLPLFAAGIWLECKHLVGMVRKTLTGTRPTLEKGIATALAAVAVLFAGAVAQNYAGGIRTFTFELSRDRAAMLKEKRGAYNWLSRSTDPRARVVAYEDASLYLYTSRAASRTFTIPTVDFYEREKLEGDVEHIMDVARAIQADYLVSSADDYDMEWSEASQLSHAQTAKLEQSLPLEYRSERNHVRVYSLACLQDPSGHLCEMAKKTAIAPNPGNATLAQFQETGAR